MEYEVKQLPAVRVAYLRYKGKFGAPIGEFWHEVFTPWQKAHGLVGKVTYGVAQDDPHCTPPDQCRYDACVEISDIYPLKEPAREAYIAAGSYAVHAFHGKADQVPQAWAALFDRLHADGKNPAGASFERYPADYAMDPATGEFDAELCVPLSIG